MDKIPDKTDIDRATSDPLYEAQKREVLSDVDNKTTKAFAKSNDFRARAKNIKMQEKKHKWRLIGGISAGAGTLVALIAPFAALISVPIGLVAAGACFFKASRIGHKK